MERKVARLAGPAAALALALATLQPLASPDTFGHLAQGREIAALGRVPDVDTRSFWRPEPAPWRNYEWLSDLVAWASFSAAGPDAVIALHCALAAAAGALFVWLAGLHGGPRAAMLCALLLVFAIPAARFRLTARPHLFGWPLAAAYLIGLGHLVRVEPALGLRATRAWIAGLALAHALWVNLHGSHLLGLSLTLIHALVAWPVRAARAPLSALLGLLVLASCVSPFGPLILIDALEHVVHPAYRALVLEWGGWQADHPAWLVIAPLAQTLLLAAAAVPLWRKDLAARALLVSTLLLAVASFRSIRFTAEYLVIGAPALAVAGARLASAWPWRRLAPALATAAVVAMVAVPVLAARLPPYRGIGHGIRTDSLPAASAAWLDRHAHAPRVLAWVDESWYLAFAVPEARLFIDGRLPFFGPAHIQRLRLAFAHPGALADVLERYRVDAVVARHDRAGRRSVIETMRARPGWALATVEDHHALFVRLDLVLRRGATLAPSALAPGYELSWLVEADAESERAIRRDLARLPRHPNNAGYRAWVRSLLALRPFLRGGGRAGVREPEDAEERAIMAGALRELRRASARARRVPIVQAYHALVATALCELDEAERAAARARLEQASRETLFVEQEIALRRGETRAVKAFLERASEVRGAEADLWIEALRLALASPPRCPRQ